MNCCVKKAFNRGVVAICLISLFAPMFNLTSSAQKKQTPPNNQKASEKSLAGTWDVSYQDALLGEITGSATVSEDEKSARVILQHPRTKVEYQLQSTEIRREGDLVTITLSGKSPEYPLSKPLGTGFIGPNPLPRLEVGENDTKATVKVGDFKAEVPVKPKGTADLDRIEIKLKIDNDGNLYGAWSYRADPETERDRRGRGRVGTFSMLDGPVSIGQQTGREVWSQSPAVICPAIVLDDQVGLSPSGQPKHPYPFQPGGQQRDTRTLIVYGTKLPRDYKEKINFASDDPALEYSTLALDTDKDLSPDKEKLFKAGRDAAVQLLDAETADLVRKMNAMLVRVDLRNKLLPGWKYFSINGAETYWQLQFGDNIADFSFAREITGEPTDPSNLNWDQVELTRNLYLPERAYLEIRTVVPLPLDEIKLRVKLNKAPVLWNGETTITARYIKDEPTGQLIEIPHDDRPHEFVKKTVRVYRTPLIELVEIGTPQPPKQPGVLYLPNVKPNDLLMAVPENLFLFAPWLAMATITKDPAQSLTVVRDETGNEVRDEKGNVKVTAEEVLTWRDALTKSAIINGYKVTDWNQLTGKEAYVIANLVISKPLLQRPRLPRPSEIRDELNENAVLHPLKFWIGFFVKSQLTEKTTVTVADHAALLMFRDAFVRKMEGELKKKEELTKGNFIFRGQVFSLSRDETEGKRELLLKWREEHKPEAYSDASPWHSIRISGPDGTKIPFSFALSDGYLEEKFHLEKFPENKKAADAWLVKAIAEGLSRYRELANGAIARAKAIKDGDVEALIKLIGYGYEMLLPEVLPRMMKPQNVGSRQLWVPDLNARFSLWRLHILVDAVRSQEDLAKQDDVMKLVVLGAIAEPFSKALAIGLAIGGLFIDKLEEKVWLNEEIRFALGAALVLGTNRLNEAELRDSEWWNSWPTELLLTALFGAAGAAAHVVLKLALTKMVQTLRAVAEIRTALLLRKIERGGLEAFKNLSETEKINALTFISEAKRLEELGAEKMMTKTHRRALAVTEKLQAEVAAKNPKPPVDPKSPTSVVKAEGEPGPVKEPAKSKRLDLEEQNGTSLVKTTETVEPAPVKPARPEFIQMEPTPGLRWATQSKGKTYTFKLGELVSDRGANALVFDLAEAMEAGKPIPGCEQDCVIKIGRPEEKVRSFPTKRDAALGTAEGARILGEERIPQVEIIFDGSEATRPFFIQRKIKGIVLKSHKVEVPLADGSTRIIREWDAETLRKAGESGLSLKDVQRLVTELAYKMKERGVAMEDFHGGNLCIEPDESGRLVAKVFDQDRIIRFYDRANARQGWWFAYYETNVAFEHVESLFNARPNEFDLVDGRRFFTRNPGPYWPDVEFFWHKQFEYKGWINVKPVYELNADGSFKTTLKAKKIIIGCTWESGLLDLDIVKEKFPRIDDPANLKPIDTSQPFWMQRGLAEPPNKQGFLTPRQTVPFRQRAPQTEHFYRLGEQVFGWESADLGKVLFIDDEKGKRVPAILDQYLSTRLKIDRARFVPVWASL